MYDHKKIEAKWQAHWDKFQSYKTTDKSLKKFYVLDMFPYPSGTGLHVGHPKGYTATDIVARWKRLQGFDVLHPIGWDAFGLPAEQYAIQTGNHPAKFTQKNINNFRVQLKKLGFSFDYLKEVNTTDPHYYKWTQWIFLALYKKGLAEKKQVEVNWCEALGTVLANEEVVADEHGNPVSERGGFPVVKKPLMQWVLKITAYADRLYNDLDGLDWPESLKNLQRNWIKNPDGTLHLKDWVFSRQRYWGEPIPIAFDSKNHPVTIVDLPLILPEMNEIKPSGTGESPLANNKEWLNYVVNGKLLRRETNTMPQWAGSCWYYLAYIMKNDDGSYLALDSPEAFKRFKKWLPVDLYVGGQEHAVLHLLYARFWHKVLYDIGVVPTNEPFYKIVNQGMILGPDNQKMSKSRGNVVNPDQIIEEFGADTLRVYEMFMGPLEDAVAWSETAIHGIRKWLDRVYRLFQNNIEHVKALRLHSALKTFNQNLESNFNKFVMEISQDIEHLKFNTAVSKMMIYINMLYKVESITDLKYLRDFLVIFSLFAPHLAEELLFLIGEKEISKQNWPTFDSKLVVESTISISVQVDGKTRAILEITGTETKARVVALAKQAPNVAKYLDSKTITKTMYVPNKTLIFILAK